MGNTQKPLTMSCPSRPEVLPDMPHSLIWLPHSITASAEQFGAMGVAFSILSWLFGAGVVLVVTATGGAVITEFIAAP